MHDELQNAGLGVPSRPGFRPLSEYIAEVERDPEMKARLDAARDNLRSGRFVRQDFEPTDPNDGIPEEEKHSARVLVWLAFAFVALVAGWAVLG